MNTSNDLQEQHSPLKSSSLHSLYRTPSLQEDLKLKTRDAHDVADEFLGIKVCQVGMSGSNNATSNQTNTSNKKYENKNHQQNGSYLNLGIGAW
jgi:hypothetical protein